MKTHHEEVKHLRHILLAALLLLPASAALGARPQRDTLGVGIPVLFEENLGQWDIRVRFQAQLHNAAMFLEDDGITFVLRDPIPHPAPYSIRPPAHHAYKMHFAGASAIPAGEARQPGYSNYYIGNNPARWRSRVGAYANIRYSALYPAIDLELYSASKALKYNFIVHPGGNPADIRLRYEGTDGVSVNAAGNLVVRTSVRDILELKPYVYQTFDGKEREVGSRWRVSRKDDGFEATIEVDRYDRGRDLVVDPTLIFSTYTGSTADNWGTTATYDSEKNTYTAGLVFNIGYPVSLGAYDPDYNGAVDIGIFKFDTNGSQRLFATYLGGSAADMPHSMYANQMDELLIFGTTGSDDFPTTAGAYQTTHSGGTLIDYESSIIRFPNGSDIFVSRFSSDGTALEASTLVGGSGNDGLNYKQHYNNNYITIMAGNDSLYYNYGDGARGEIVTDNLGNVYVGSTTTSADFPTTAGASVQPTHAGGQDGIILKLDYNLRNLLWSSYLGGNGDDAVYSIDVDSAYNVILCGGSSSNNFPTTAGSYQPAFSGGTADGFVSIISHDGAQLLSSSYIGSSAYDQLYFVRVGNNNEVFLFGQTGASGSSMIYNAGYSVPGSGMLLMRMVPDLSARRWSTVFGTPGRINISPTAFAADICNRVYAAGWGRDFVNYNGVRWYTAGTHGMETTPDAYSDSTDGQDFYIISLDANGNRLEYATFFGELHQAGGSSYGGGDHVDGGTSRFDRLATLYQSVCGSCAGTQGFPTTAGAWSSVNLSTNCNNALFRFNITENFPVAEFIPPHSGCTPYVVNFQNTGRGAAFHWDFGDGTSSTEHSPTHTYAQPGTYTVTLVASLPGGCSESDTIAHTFQVLSPVHASHTLLKTCNSSSIQIGVTPSIGVSYQWTVGSVSDPTIANPWVNQTGLYVLKTITDVCTQTDTFLVQNYTLVSQLLTTPVSCRDSADGAVRLSLGPSVDPDSIVYTISPSAPDQVGTGSILFSRLVPGTRYRINVSGYGCSYNQDVLLDNPAPVLYTKQLSPALCTDSCTGWIHITRTPAIDTLLSGLCEGTYITRLTYEGCPLVDTSRILRNHALDSLHVWADADRILLGESVRLHAESAGGDVGYAWYPPADLDRPDSPAPLATPSDTLACYSVTATAGACSAKDSLCIRCTEIICGPPYFVIPNAFTPNADGINDAVYFPTEGITEFSIYIFNRWGERVFESTDPSRCWDGTYRNNPCLPGVYTYTCHIRCVAGEENDFKGDITLIR